jgi:hypothetical protein
MKYLVIFPSIDEFLIPKETIMELDDENSA